MSDNAKSFKVSFYAAVLLFRDGPVLSSGPTRPIGVKGRLVFRAERHRNSFNLVMEDVASEWWSVTYRPLHWASEQLWGAALRWYWDLFPAAPYECG